MGGVSEAGDWRVSAVVGKVVNSYVLEERREKKDNVSIERGSGREASEVT